MGSTVSTVGRLSAQSDPLSSTCSVNGSLILASFPARLWAKPLSDASCRQRVGYSNGKTRVKAKKKKGEPSPDPSANTSPSRKSKIEKRRRMVDGAHPLAEVPCDYEDTNEAPILVTSTIITQMLLVSIGVHANQKHRSAGLTASGRRGVGYSHYYSSQALSKFNSAGASTFSDALWVRILRCHRAIRSPSRR